MARRSGYRKPVNQLATEKDELEKLHLNRINDGIKVPAETGGGPTQPLIFNSTLLKTDFGFVRAQESAKRALTIALSGDHRILLIGPPKQGKTLLIEAAKTIEIVIDDETYFYAEEFSLRDNWRSADPEIRSSSQNEMLETAYNGDFDMHVEVPKVPFLDLIGRCMGTDSATVKRQVKDARRFADDNPQTLELSDYSLSLLRQAYQELGMSPDSVVKCVNVARTIANLGNSKKIDESHLAEAIQYRLLDCKIT